MQNIRNGKTYLEKHMDKIIKTDSDYKVALAELEKLIDLVPEKGSPQSDRLELLSLLLHDYERRKVKPNIPNPVDAIKFRMEQQDLSPRDLIPMIGSRSKVSEVLANKRPLTLSMIRALHSTLGIPASVLLQEAAEFELEKEIEWLRFPIKEMISRGWIKHKIHDVKSDTESALRYFFGASSSGVGFDVLYRKSDHMRSARQMDSYALAAWTAQIANKARENPPSYQFNSKSMSIDFLRKVAQLSWSEKGPLLAQEFLHSNGIPLIIEPHLPHTFLDGATIFLNPDYPVIGLTLRYDRTDNFWFTLMHELSHVVLHSKSEFTKFFDDLDLEDSVDSKEKEAERSRGGCSYSRRYMEEKSR